MLLLAAALLAVQRDLPRGQVIERVQAASDPAQTEAAVREMQQALREPADMAQRQEAAVRLKDLILKLRSQADAPRDSATRRVARRILGGFAVGLIDQGGALLERKSYDAAARSLSIAADMQPQWPSTWFELARAHALGGNAKQAIQALEKAVDAGLRDAAQIEAEPAFEKLRGTAQFAAIVERAK
jgi:tetratricopeptide (TPR) repeat protein